jgi:3alpha(or 20beta)-hydroxysteroid dehydrogenase
MARLTDKVVLISGGARGIGEASARAMVAEGARVVLGDLLDDVGRALAHELGSFATYVHLDVTSPADWDAAVVAAESTYGRLDALVNNAGIVAFGGIDTLPQAQWDQVLAVNLTGVYHGMRAALPALKRALGGSIVNVSSTAGLKGYPSLAGYVASKWGVRGLTKAAALDLGKDKIRVNSVHPGFIRTPMTSGIEEDTHLVALDRTGEPIEVAQLILYLVSDESTFCTGAEFTADGGESAGTVANPPKR